MLPRESARVVAMKAHTMKSCGSGGEIREEKVEKLRKVFNYKDSGFVFSLNSADMDIREFVGGIDIVEGDKFELVRARAYVGGRLGTTWGGAVIVKK